MKIALHTPEMFMFFQTHSILTDNICKDLVPNPYSLQRGWETKIPAPSLKARKFDSPRFLFLCVPSMILVVHIIWGFEVCFEILVKSYYSIGFWEPKVCFFLIESPQIEILFQVPTGLYT